MYNLLIIIYNLLIDGDKLIILFISSGSGWKLINGNNEGQTQECRDLYNNKSAWNHPIDLHYTTQTLQRSPKLLVQIFARDNHGRVLFIAYGTSSVPLIPGSHEIKCHTWKPIGILSYQFFFF